MLADNFISLLIMNHMKYGKFAINLFFFGNYRVKKHIAAQVITDYKRTFWQEFSHFLYILRKHLLEYKYIVNILLANEMSSPVCCKFHIFTCTSLCCFQLIIVSYEFNVRVIAHIIYMTWHSGICWRLGQREAS